MRWGGSGEPAFCLGPSQAAPQPARAPRCHHRLTLGPRFRLSSARREGKRPSQRHTLPRRQVSGRRPTRSQPPARPPSRPSPHLLVPASLALDRGHSECERLVTRPLEESESACCETVGTAPRLAVQSASVSLRGGRSCAVRAGYRLPCTVGPHIGPQCVDDNGIDPPALVVREALSCPGLGHVKVFLASFIV